MRIEDKGSYTVDIYRVPPFPAHMEQELFDRQVGGNEAKEFLDWWCEAASVRGWRHPGRPMAEEWVHARRMLSRYSVESLKRKAVSYFPEAYDEWHGVKLMRGFVVWLRSE